MNKLHYKQKAEKLIRKFPSLHAVLEVSAQFGGMFRFALLLTQVARIRAEVPCSPQPLATPFRYSPWLLLSMDLIYFRLLRQLQPLLNPLGHQLHPPPWPPAPSQHPA